MTRRRLAILALGLCASLPAAAYRWDQHYFTVRLVYGAREGGAVAALCGQLADEAPELNAITVYQRLMKHPFDYTAWTLRGAGPDATVGRMVTIQQMLHGLTGGSPEAVRAIASATARVLVTNLRGEKDPQKRADAECAVGFAMHLYGDSYSHARIKNPSKMYGTGLGHFYDASLPDQPLSSPARFEQWRNYLISAQKLLFEDFKTGFEPVFTSAAASQLRARSGNGFAHDELLAAERSALKESGIDATPLRHNTAGLDCQSVADLAAKNLPRAPSCEGAWTLYREAATAAFDAYDADPAHDSAPSRGPVKRPFFTGSPFGPGANW
jgi:DNA-binding transcriptional regulator YdaS (Cro superfamily)